MNGLRLKRKFFFLVGAELFKDTLKAFDYFKNKQEILWSNAFNK